MTDHLSDRLRQANRLGIISDFDGTLSEIVPDRFAAQMLPEIHQTLQALQPHLSLLALVSGRGAADLQGRAGIEGAVYVGNHGMERWQAGEVVPNPQAAAFRPNLERLMAALDLPEGLLLEDKGVTLSLHYRSAPNPAAIAEQMTPILQQLADENGLWMHGGKMIFEIRPPVEINKGTAFADLVQEYALDTVIFLGDDVTDADAMRVAQDLRQSQTCHAYALGVQSDDMPQAVRDYSDFWALDVADVGAFLAWVLMARNAS